MSVKHAILGLLLEKPRHGYEIKIGFEQMLLRQWPLNTGQVYTTLERLVRDGLVKPLDDEAGERKPYIITEQGKQELKKWLLEPVKKSVLKDEMVFKLLCARAIRFPHIPEMITNQKKAVMETLMKMTKLKNQLHPSEDREMLILLEGGLLHLEADLKWLEWMEEQWATESPDRKGGS
jgi:DNA-binding PadR family transcriptional regulator